ncbi:MAG TPA: hypothetical protein VGP25_22485 [Gemmatimonadaceae bacterium]|nr:hypothetical protein [Gemmatimonadaceae bacterium]
MSARHRQFEDRWTPCAGQGTLGASYLPCCVARLAAGTEWEEARAGLALLWSERASALRFRRAVLAMAPPSREGRLALARLQREGAAYEAGAARIRRISITRVRGLIAHLASRAGNPVVGATFSTMSAELAVTQLALRADGTALDEIDADTLPRAERRSRPA